MDFGLIENLFPLVLAILLALVVPTAMVVISSFLSSSRVNASKLSTYECGIQASGQAGDSRSRVNIRFFLIAMCFLVFDVEVIFLFPWAVLFQKMAWGGFLSMLAFLGVLAFGWLYLLKRGALEWE